MEFSALADLSVLVLQKKKTCYFSILIAFII